MAESKCGTYAGAKVHSRRNEKNCDPCRIAKNAYEAERRRNRRQPSPVRSVSDRFWAKVKKTQTCWNWTAGKNMRDGYGIFWDGERYTGAHRFAYFESFGAIPEGMFIDHKCHNSGCVNPDHLRAATPKQNVENRSGIRSNNTSGYLGVYWNKNAHCWTASVVHHGQAYFLGRFSTREDANAAATAKRLELFTHNDADRKAA
jgi:hypothetical protein